MGTPFIIGTIVTSKVVQVLFVTTIASKMRKSMKKRKVVDQSWKLTQFLEESKYVK
jgi:hypothetical protein